MSSQKPAVIVEAFRAEKERKEKEARRAKRRKARDEAAAAKKTTQKRSSDSVEDNNPTPAKRIRFAPGDHPDETTRDGNNY